MPNVLTVAVDNPDELLDTGAYGSGAVVRVQSATAQAGTYADLTGTGSTPTLALVAATKSYKAYDPTGDSSTWYRTRYEDSGATRTSDWSVPFLIGYGLYASLTDLKQRIGREGDTTDDENLLELLEMITDYTRGECQREFLDSSTEYTFDGIDAVANGRCLVVHPGIRTLTTLEVAAITGGTLQAVPSTAFVLRPKQQDRTPGWPYTEVWFTDNAVGSPFSCFPSGYDNVRMVGSFGFGSVPRRVEEVVLNTAVRAWASRQAGQSDWVGAGQDGGSAVVSAYVSKRDRATLMSFRRLLVG